LAAAALAANYVLSMKSLRHVSPAESSVLSLMNGVLLMGCGVLFLQERLSRLQSAGLLVFGVGQGLFLLPRLAGSAFDARFALGAGLVGISAVAWLGYALVQRVVQQRLSAVQVLWLVCCGAALWLLPLVSTSGFESLDRGGWWALAVSCACTLVAYSAFAQAMQHWTVSGATTVTSLSPVLVWLMSLAAVAAGVAGVTVPQVGPLGIIGAVLAIVGGALAALGQARPAQKPALRPTLMPDPGP
jgi:drug/metabolite transporter (DMT)-like permease